MSNYVLLTGATGLLGQYLLRDLLLSGRRVAVLARSRGDESAQFRIESILQNIESRIGRPLSRPIVFEGDICSPSFGLREEEQDWLARNCDQILHNAAAVSFHSEEETGEPWRSNLEGTRNCLSVCRELNILNFFYVSTAYVCGIRDSLVKEDELEAGQEFRNDYERSKHQAEQLLRSADFLQSLTVFRPAVISGDSQTGYTSTYHGLYMYLKLMAVLMSSIEPNEAGYRPLELRLMFTGEDGRNIMPLDWVSSVITHLYNTPKSHGRTYHLTPERPITAREIIEYASSYFNGGGVEYCGSNITYEELNDFERMIHDNMAMYESYDSTDPQFDTSNLKRFAPHLPCPQIDEPMLHRFIQFGEEDRWGKRKPAPGKVDRWASDLLPSPAQLAESPTPKPETNGIPAKRLYEEVEHVIGLEVIGTGGGQWCLTLSGDRILDIEIGLPSGSEPIVQLSCEELEKLVQTGKRPKEQQKAPDEANLLSPVTLLARALRPAQDDTAAQVT